VFAQFEIEPFEPYALALLLECGTSNMQLSAIKSTKQIHQKSLENTPALEWHSYWISNTREFEQKGERNTWFWQNLQCR
jgi:hypothetical protein